MAAKKNDFPRTRLRLGAALAGSLLACGVSLAAPLPVRDLRTSIALDPGVARSLGLELRRVASPAAFEHHDLSVSAGRDVAFEGLGPLGLALEVDGRVFRRLAGGSVGHRGGFELGYPGGALSLQGFVLAAGAMPRTFELRAADGELAFTADTAHFAFDPGSGHLRVFNMDLRIAPPLARRLGNPKLTGLAVGALALDAHAQPEPRVELPSGGACDDWSGQVDVALTAISSIGQTERQGGQVSMAPSAALENVGTANVPWYGKFTGSHPPYGNDQHPFLVWQLYRIEQGVLEQMAVSDVKHAFLTVNDDCDPGACEDDHILGLGCQDVYSQNTNNSYETLSYRSELTAGKGLWNSTGSHFDQNGDGEQDHPPGNPDAFPAHRLAVPEAQLDVAGTTYLFEAWYIVRDDVDIFNGMAWREIDPDFNGSSWTFDPVTDTAQGSVLDAWVDPVAPGPNARNQVVTVADGHVRLAMKATDLGGGLWRYEYALMNHDFDPQLATFTIPTGGANLTNLRFRDIDADSANDWLPTLTAAGITWAKPAAAPGLDWGRMHNFGFTANAGPVTRQATMNAVEATTPSQLSITTLGPNGTAQPLFFDGFETGSTSQWNNTVP